MGFSLPNLEDTVRGPDVAFVRAGRIVPEEIRDDAWLTIAPDFVVEVRSPSDEKWEIDEKVGDYLVAGVRMIWLVDPRRRAVTVFRGAESHELSAADRLDGADVLPGLVCEVEELFRGLVVR